MASTTLSSYEQGVNCFKRFCALSHIHVGCNGIPASPKESLLEDFVAYCATHLKLSYASIKLYVCGIRHAYIMQGHGNILADKPRLDLTLRGIKKTMSKPKQIRLPITTDTLLKVHCVLSRGLNGQYMDTMLWAVLC